MKSITIINETIAKNFAQHILNLHITIIILSILLLIAASIIVRYLLKKSFTKNKTDIEKQFERFIDDLDKINKIKTDQDYQKTKAEVLKIINKQDNKLLMCEMYINNYNEITTILDPSITIIIGFALGLMSNEHIIFRYILLALLVITFVFAISKIRKTTPDITHNYKREIIIDYIEKEKSKTK